MAAINSGRATQAEDKARELLARNPSSGFLWKALGVILWAQGKNARYELERASQLCPNDAEAHSNLGNVLLESGQLDQAVASCRRALEINPRLAEAYNNIGNALRGLGRLDEAMASYRQALAINPDLAMVHNNLGTALYDLGRFAEATVSYRSALQAQPHFAAAHNNLGNTLRALGRLEEALTCFRQALEVKHDYAEAHNNLGSALLDLGEAQEAAASYRRALALRADYAESHSNLATALQRLEQFEEAVTSSRRAIEIRADFAAAHNALGNALRALKHPHEALRSYRRALESEPNYAEAHANAGDVLLELMQFDDSLASYRRAIEIKSDYAEAHAKLGNVLLHLWQAEDAAASCRRALEIKPGYAEAHNGLGYALLSLGSFEDAQASFRLALELKPDYAEAYTYLGHIKRLENRDAEAEANCRKALELKPRSILAIALLAELHADRGEFAEAERLYRNAAEIDPEAPLPWARIAFLRKMTHGDTAWLAQARRIAGRRWPPRQESMLHYALGKYFDDVKDFPQAFSHYQRANELAKFFGRKYDRALMEQRIDQIMRLYDRAWLSRAYADSDRSLRPVFIIGLPRTGTTLAQQILASHAAVCSVGAQGHWHLVSVKHETGMASGSDSLISISDMAREYLRLLQEFSTDALRVVEKTNSNFFWLGLIHAALPNARIIHMQRNPIDTCLSNYFVEFNTSHPQANDLQHLAHYYHEYARLMAHWRSILPADSILDVPYEALVSDQEAWSRRMVEFVGLPWDARCLDFHQTRSAVITASRWQVRQRMQDASIERWRNYAPFIGALLQALQARVPEDSTSIAKTTTVVAGVGFEKSSQAAVLQK